MSDHNLSEQNHKLGHKWIDVFLPIVLVFVLCASLAHAEKKTHIQLFFVSKYSPENVSSSTKLASPDIESAQTQIFYLMEPPIARDLNDRQHLLPLREVDDFMTSKKIPVGVRAAFIPVHSGFLDRLGGALNIYDLLKTKDPLLTPRLQSAEMLLESAFSLLDEVAKIWELRIQRDPTPISSELRNAWFSKISILGNVAFWFCRNIGLSDDKIMEAFSTRFHYGDILHDWIMSKRKSHVMLEAQINEFLSETQAIRRTQIKSEKEFSVYKQSVSLSHIRQYPVVMVIVDSRYSAKTWPESIFLLGSPNEIVRTRALHTFKNYFLKLKNSESEPSLTLFDSEYDNEISDPELWFFNQLGQLYRQDLPFTLDIEQLQKNSLSLLTDLLLSVKTRGFRMLLWNSVVDLLTAIKNQEGVPNKIFIPESLALEQILMVEKTLSEKEKKLIREKLLHDGGGCATVFKVH